MSRIYEQIEKDVEKIIGQYDGDKNGEVTINEAIEFFKRMGSKYPEKCAIELFKMYDLDNDGKISYDEIQEEIFKRYQDKVREDQIRQYFQDDIEAFLLRYDKNRDNKIDLKELEQCFESIGSDHPKENADHIFTEIDINRDGYLTIDEIKNYCRKTFRSKPYNQF
ncbi:hypothetical protein ACTFIY_002060 [Dictyostelium cf. discoideum]